MPVQHDGHVVSISSGWREARHELGGEVLEGIFAAVDDGGRRLGDPVGQRTAAPFDEPVSVQQQRGPRRQRAARLAALGLRRGGERERAGAFEQVDAAVGARDDAWRVPGGGVGEPAGRRIEDGPPGSRSAAGLTRRFLRRRSLVCTLEGFTDAPAPWGAADWVRPRLGLCEREGTEGPR
jgi:hypothetical protein